MSQLYCRSPPRTEQIPSDLIKSGFAPSPCLVLLRLCLVLLRPRQKILAVLFQKVSVISGSSATCDDDAIKMNSEGNWRFERKPSVFGFEASKLFLFWLRCGGFPMHLLEGNPNLIYFYREDAALEALQNYKESRPGGVSPFFYASDRGIYSKETLLQLK